MQTQFSLSSTIVHKHKNLKQSKICKRLMLGQGAEGWMHVCVHDLTCLYRVHKLVRLG